MVVVLGVVLSSGTIVDRELRRNIAFVSLAIFVAMCACILTAHKDSSWVENREAAAFLNLTPTQLIVKTFFTVCYNPMNNIATNMACQTNMYVGSLEVSATTINAVDCIACAFALAVIELMRRRARVMTELGDSICGEGIYMSDLSVLWMAVPYIMNAFAQVCINPGMYMFVYCRAPPGLRAMSQAVCLLCGGALSNTLSTVINNALSGFNTDNLNEGNLEYIFLTNMAVVCAGLVLFFFWRSKGDNEDHAWKEEEEVGDDLTSVDSFEVEQKPSVEEMTATARS